MFFARYAKQQHAERNSGNAAAEEKSHNALAQLSASGAGRKTKEAQAVVEAFVSNAGRFKQAPFTKD
jgi:hypothetical protein